MALAAADGLPVPASQRVGSAWPAASSVQRQQQVGAWSRGTARERLEKKGLCLSLNLKNEIA